MKDFINKLIASLDNVNSGFSARKLSALASVITSIVVTFQFGSSEHIEIILTIWLGFGLLCLGIITIQQLVELRTGKSSSSSSETTTKTETTSNG